ncbi:5614_t:CDS:2 [Funneliformis mosseae]|uniref:5614_t:CDS:1 n=1 Tax=Funneliformis mosseae TaxID=27381 RepID=A0A9N9DXS8_FUNMO|nr:5614_t:CDS:2 [Funneliformis mosseae]
MSTGKNALIFGATGAVGKTLLKDLLNCEYFKSITSTGRREVAYDGPNKESLIQKVIDFEKLDEHKDVFVGYDTVFCTLGTTKAQAGSAENFVKIDKDYVLNSAKLVKEQNPNKEIHYLYCSSKGANANSPFLYLKTKGEIENGLKEIGFKKLSIFRPGNLKISEPRDQGRRRFEEIALKFASVVEMIFPQKISVHVDIVGKAMKRVATNDAKVEVNQTTLENGTVFEIYEHMQIHEIGG